MESGGPSGFRNAPLTRVIVGAVSVTSLLWLSGVIKPHRQPSKLLLLLAFPQLGSLIFGLALLYQFRSLERQSGTSKFASLVGLALFVQYILLLVPVGKEAPAGPFPLIFACLTIFLIETPAMQHFSIFGVRLTEKIFTQAAAVQLILSSPRSELLLIAGGTLLGVLQHINFVGMREWKVPGAVSGRLGGMLVPLLQGDRQGHRTMVRPPQGGSRTVPAPPQRPMGQRSAAARPPSVAASREGVEQLVAMGFSEQAARSALERSNNDVQAATSLLL